MPTDPIKNLKELEKKMANDFPTSVKLDVYNTAQISLSKEALQRVLDNKSLRAVDYAPLLGIMSILENIEKQIRRP